MLKIVDRGLIQLWIIIQFKFFKMQFEFGFKDILRI